jgi:hypothetical protein
MSIVVGVSLDRTVGVVEGRMEFGTHGTVGSAKRHSRLLPFADCGEVMM